MFFTLILLLAWQGPQQAPLLEPLKRLQQEPLPVTAGDCFNVVNTADASLGQLGPAMGAERQAMAREGVQRMMKACQLLEKGGTGDPRSSALQSWRSGQEALRRTFHPQEERAQSSTSPGSRRAERADKARAYWDYSIEGSAGTVQGRVFAITRGGDLKPARLSSVVLFPGPYGGEVILRQLELALGKMKAPGYRSRDHDLMQVSAAYEAVASVGKEMMEDLGPRADDLFARADEEGQFTLPGVPPGKYLLCVVGQAGMNKAFWSRLVELRPGGMLEVKLSSPTHSYLDWR